MPLFQLTAAAAGVLCSRLWPRRLRSVCNSPGNGRPRLPRGARATWVGRCGDAAREKLASPGRKQDKL